MPNNLFNALGGKNNQPMMNPVQMFVQRFNDFKSSFVGDPKKEVMNLLQTGQMTQEQYNELGQMANQLIKVLPK